VWLVACFISWFFSAWFCFVLYALCMTKKSLTKADLQAQLDALNNEYIPDNVRVPRRLAIRVQELKQSSGMKKQEIYAAALEYYFEQLDKKNHTSK